MTDTATPSEVRALASELAEPKPMRRGSVSERYVKCNKSGCLCGARSDARHGPYYSVSRVVKGRTQSRWLSAEQSALVRQRVAARAGDSRHRRLEVRGHPGCLNTRCRYCRQPSGRCQQRAG